MRALWLVLAITGCAEDRSKVECYEITRKLRPVVEEMTASAGKPLPAGEIDKIMANACQPPTTDAQRVFRSCLLAAGDHTAARICFQADLEAYRSGPRSGPSGPGGPRKRPQPPPAPTK